MSIAVGPFFIAALLLVGGGVAKVVDPVDTVGALRGAGVRASSPMVRIGAMAEVAVGCFALAVGSRTAAVLVGLSYLAFTVFVARAIVKELPIASCGCFGREDTPPSVVHLGVNLCAVAAAAAVALDPGAGIADVVSEQPLAGAPFALLVCVGTYAAFVALTALPRTLALVRSR